VSAPFRSCWTGPPGRDWTYRNRRRRPAGADG